MSSKYEKLEKQGFNVVAMDRNGKMDYATNMNKGSDYCDTCEKLMFVPDPDPDDWFRDEDQKAICTTVNKTIQGGLEFNELTNIKRPEFCPKLRETKE